MMSKKGSESSATIIRPSYRRLRAALYTGSMTGETHDDSAGAATYGGTLTHLDETGAAQMVDVSGKDITSRTAVAGAFVELSDETLELLRQSALPKGDVLAVSRIAGIQAAKRCSDLIPLCHPLPLSKVKVDLELQARGVQVRVECRVNGRTGVEMEALTGASVAALTIYDMCKAVDRGIRITAVELYEKHGGKTGSWLREPAS